MQISSTQPKAPLVKFLIESKEFKICLVAFALFFGGVALTNTFLHGSHLVSFALGGAGLGTLFGAALLTCCKDKKDVDTSKVVTPKQTFIDETPRPTVVTKKADLFQALHEAIQARDAIKVVEAIDKLPDTPYLYYLAPSPAGPYISLSKEELFWLMECPNIPKLMHEKCYAFFTKVFSNPATDVNAKQERTQLTLLHMIASWIDPYTLEPWDIPVANTSRLRLVHILLSRGADPLAFAPDVGYPFHSAISIRDLACVQTLSEKISKDDPAFQSSFLTTLLSHFHATDKSPRAEGNLIRILYELKRQGCDILRGIIDSSSSPFSNLSAREIGERIFTDPLRMTQFRALYSN